MRRLRVILTGGGTGGHVYPLLALAEVAGSEADFLFCGGMNGLESHVVPRAGLPFTALPSAALLGRRPVEGVRALRRIMAGIAQAIGVVRHFRPDVVVSTAGYAGYPVGQAAVVLRRPLVVVEPNARPGLGTRALARFADAVCVGFPQGLEVLGKRAVWTGVPLRRSLWAGHRDRALQHFDLDPDRRTVLVLGGSQGAASLNRATLEAIRVLRDRRDLQILHQTGIRRAGITDAPDADGLRYVQVDYIEEMADAYAVADLVVSRAGAVTCAELAALGLAAILVPLPIASGHQMDNARTLEQEGAAVVVPDPELDGVGLARTITALLDDPERLGRMRKAATRIGRPDAASSAWRVCTEVARR
jgi:UDP-N-acetylglucosamine--N-acetylmuramyl-(pentapeptide) pyrophosphoryl-undecaprenol N-acetylglucosamine transferase